MLWLTGWIARGKSVVIGTDEIKWDNIEITNSWQGSGTGIEHLEYFYCRDVTDKKTKRVLALLIWWEMVIFFSRTVFLDSNSIHQIVEWMCWEKSCVCFLTMDNLQEKLLGIWNAWQWDNLTMPFSKFEILRTGRKYGLLSFG